MNNVSDIQLEMARQQPESLVLVTGVFDILHQEHTTFLQAAKAVGDYLVVGLETDERTRKLKGPSRPVNPLAQRYANIEALGIADSVFVLPKQFDTPVDHERLIEQIRPAYLAVSAHTAHLQKKQAILEKYGGSLVVVRPHNPNISTTKILEKQR